MIALFDMDGTLFAGDSQLRFARWVLRRYAWRRLYLLIVLPALLLRLCRVLSEEQVKRLFLSYAWGMRRETLQAECRTFVEQELLPAMFPEVLAKLRAHQEAGDVTALCSASPEWWTQYVAESLGFTHCIATPVPYEERVPRYPPIPAPGNNKGQAKLVRLAQLGITRADVGYTDSTADLPMLSICRRSVLVNPSSRLQRKAPEAEALHASRCSLFFVPACVLGLTCGDEAGRIKPVRNGGN